MNNATETTQTKTATVACPSVQERLNQATLALTVSFAGLVSLWSFAGLAGAFVNNGSAEIARGLFTAFTGL